MIVKQTSEYNALFENANNLLQEAFENHHNNDSDPFNRLIVRYEDEVPVIDKIVDLVQYYSYLDLICQAAEEKGQTIYQNDEQAIKEYGENYVRLPLDEEPLKINANTRKIEIPTSFARNGIGVQTDHVAEILYFDIDRYFDSADLATQNIIIEWQIVNKDRQPEYGYSSNFGKDLTSNPGHIIFGWPISADLTQMAGTIKFAVRFYSLQDNNTLRYSFSTLPAELQIGAALNSLEKVEKETNCNGDIMARLKIPGRPIINDEATAPGDPEIIRDLFAFYETSDSQTIEELTLNEGKIDLVINDVEYTEATDINESNYDSSGLYVYVENNNKYMPAEEEFDALETYYRKAEVEKEVKFGIEAKPSDKGVIDCLWYNGKNNDNQHSESVIYVKPLEQTDQDDFTYYKKEDSQYKVAIKPYTNFPDGYYEKVFVYNPDAVGEYNAVIRATALTNSKDIPSENTIIVPGPTSAEGKFRESIVDDTRENSIQQLSNDEDEIHFIFPKVTENTEYTITLKSGITLEDNKDTTEYEYQWYKDNEISTGNNGADLEITQELTSDTEIDEMYYVMAKGTRNNKSEESFSSSKSFHITTIPVAPTVYIYNIQDNNWLNYTGNQIGESIITNRTNGNITNAIKLYLNPDNILDGKYTFYVVKAGEDESDPYINKEIRIGPNADDELIKKLHDKFSPTVEATEEDLDTVTVIFSNKSKDELPTGNNFSDHQDYYCLSSGNISESGYYYAILARKYNGYTVYTVTPMLFY